MSNNSYTFVNTSGDETSPVIIIHANYATGPTGYIYSWTTGISGSTGYSGESGPTGISGSTGPTGNHSECAEYTTYIEKGCTGEIEVRVSMVAENTMR